MKFPGRVDGSVCGAVLSRKPSTSRTKNPTLIGRPNARKIGPRAFGERPISTIDTIRQKQCPQSAQWLMSTFMPELQPRSLRSQFRRDGQTIRSFSSNRAAGSETSTANPTPFFTQRSKDEMQSYVHGDTKETVDERLGAQGYTAHVEKDGQIHRDNGLKISDGEKDILYPRQNEVLEIGDEYRHILTEFHTAVAQRIQSPQTISLESVYDIYESLPEPRMARFTGYWRNRFLKIMGMPDKRDVHSMLRYFSLISEVKSAGLALRRHHWNYALAFATKYSTSGLELEDVETALRLWREMEHEGKTAGNEVTFHLLFDAASKAGNFNLAEMIYQEMQHRGIEFNRYHHVSLIHYFGLKADSAGVRAAYREMVEAGEMIDTVVLNCVIFGLLRCGEESAAEETYDRMKWGSALPADMPQRDYTMNKVITRVLMMFSRVGKRHPSLKDLLQRGVSRTPNLHTYWLLVYHYAVKVGDLPRVARYLDEMKIMQIPVHPLIFLGIFKGFYAHGGFEGSQWSERRLQGVLKALYQAKDDHGPAFKLDRWVIIWALRAFRKCSPSVPELTKTFDELALRWDIPPDRQPWMHDLFDLIATDRDMNSDSGDWEGPLHSRRRKGGGSL